MWQQFENFKATCDNFQVLGTYISGNYVYVSKSYMFL